MSCFRPKIHRATTKFDAEKFLYCIIFLSTLDTEADPKQAKKLEKQLKIMEGRKEKEESSKRLPTFKGTAKAVNLAHKLSPKLQRKKDKNDQVAQLKVNLQI